MKYSIVKMKCGCLGIAENNIKSINKAKLTFCKDCIEKQKEILRGEKQQAKLSFYND